MPYQRTSIQLKSVLVLLASIVIATSIEHTIGNKYLFGSGDVLYKGELFNKSTLDQHNYTIRYKYLGTSFGEAISFAQINVTGAQKSSSEMSYSSDIDKNIDRFVDATIDVVNATNFASTVEIRGFEGIRIDGLSTVGRVVPRSYACTCMRSHHAKEKMLKKHLIQFGQRIPGDFLVRFQSERSVDGKLRLDFHDPFIKLNYISVVANSPWAVVFTNKIITTQHRFGATIYDLRLNNFDANLIIYGTSI